MIEYVLFVIGIFLLIKGADYLVEGSSSLAKRLNVSTLVIGLTIVAFGTSTPELFVNIFSAVKGSTDVAFGNILGSNIANILLVLGVVAMISPIKMSRSTKWKDIPFSFLAVVVLLIVSNYFLIDRININSLTKVSGLIFLSFLAVFLYYTYLSAKRTKTKFKLKDIDIEGERQKYVIFFMIVGGLIALYFGGEWVVAGAVTISEALGLSQFLISATIIAIGTSLPELATGLVAVKKKDTELAVGNVLGSNIFNIFWILGITALIAPIAIPSFINFDIIFLGFATLLLFAFLFMGRKETLEKWQGFTFILLYMAYILYIIYRG